MSGECLGCQTQFAVDALHDALDVASLAGRLQHLICGVVDREDVNEGLAVSVLGVAGWERSGGAERHLGAGPGPRSLLGGMPERRWRVLGRGRGLFAIEVDDGGGFRAATTAEVDAALRQRELFGAPEYTVRHVGSADDDRDDVDVG